MGNPQLLRQAILSGAQRAVSAPGVPGPVFQGSPYGHAFGPRRPQPITPVAPFQATPAPTAMPGGPEPPPVLTGDPVLMMLRRMRGF